MSDWSETIWFITVLNDLDLRLNDLKRNRGHLLTMTKHPTKYEDCRLIDRQVIDQKPFGLPTDRQTCAKKCSPISFRKGIKITKDNYSRNMKHTVTVLVHCNSQWDQPPITDGTNYHIPLQCLSAGNDNELWLIKDCANKIHHHNWNTLPQSIYMLTTCIISIAILLHICFLFYGNG